MATEQSSNGADTVSITEMMRQMLEDRQKREAELAEDRRRREEEITEERRRQRQENDERMQEMRDQVAMLQRLVTERSTPTAREPSDGRPALKLTRLGEADDIEAYLVTFERTMEAYEVDGARWSFMLAPQLTGKAQQAYAAMAADSARRYDDLKAAILRRYNINEETYRRRFRATKLKAGETPRELAIRLSDLAGHWAKDCTGAAGVLDLVVKEQLLSALPEDARLWVSEHKPKTSQEAGQLAEDFLQARQSVSWTPAKPTGGEPPRTPCPKCGQPGHWARDCPKAKTGTTFPRGQTAKPGREALRCYNCREPGHLAAKCPSNAALYCEGREARDPAKAGQEVHRDGTIAGVPVSDILLDTGATRSMIHTDLLPPGHRMDGKVTIRCAHGNTVAYPLAEITVEIGSRRFAVKAGVSPTLPVPVLLGRDVPELKQLLEEEPPEPDDVLAVTTRAQSQRLERVDALTQARELEDGAQTNPVDGTDEGASGSYTPPPDDLPGSEFDDSLFLPIRRPARLRMSRSQRRESNRRYVGGGAGRADTDDHAPQPGDLNSAELQKLQEEDATLAEARRVAAGQPGPAGADFFMRDGLLYRRYRPPWGRGEESATIEQMVLPTQCRKTVLKLAHDVPLAGHMGRNKTGRRILQRFYWPSLYRDVARYCRSCPECQKASPRRVKRAPLVPLPVMDEPFRRIAMDIVGPLPRSRSGKRYILVICDYATRYPEAIPLRSIDAETVAEELLTLFSRVGVPEEILTDQGSNFMSKLLGEVYRLLHVTPIRTSPYHPQTDGLVERFNQTLKSMLRKAATDEGKDWDRLIPYLLFAYREVPQASTGFSPFELLYGRHVRGPLDVLRETWEASRRSDESVVSYVLMVQERLAKLTELVQGNLAKSQQVQKTWYDRHARSREFQPGDQVLVLLPTSASKLLAEWQGPYPVVRRMGRVTYEVDMTDRRKRKRIFHVNMLRSWVGPDTSYLAEEVCGVDDDEIVPWDGRPEGEHPALGDHLSPTQVAQLDALLHEFEDVLQERPGRTSLTQHRIDVGGVRPIKLAPYRLPHAYKETVKSELEEMERTGVIERSRSEWAAPIVLVKKKDGSLRMCVDYRRLNAVSQADAYPMPRVDDLIDRLGKARYITTLDLSRGYWQVPVDEESRPMTAFTTPYGLFQFRVMPFGLHGAPATFQRMMDNLLWDVGPYAAAYLDDLIIHSEEWGDHLDQVRTILQKLRKAGLTLKPKKCQFAMAHCAYLGHVVGGGEVRPEDSKVQSVRSFPIPAVKKQVRAFLGITGYYRKFIPEYATLAAPLTDLTRKTSPNRVVWDERCDYAFTTLKHHLCSSPVLRSPDFDRPFILQTDASDRGVGAVLSQVDDAGDEHAIAFYSRKLLPREERYSTIEKECLAIKLGMQAFKVYLLGRRFSVQTDHRSLEWLDRIKDNNARLTRWSLELQQYDYVVQHRAGSANANADALSRAFGSSDATLSQEKGGEM